ncbi:unnamed protein product [Lepeophtheirus salmonis]|uniref:(salmon louse) hypothetical protein n=1 Tax=Lepeophtheirus salmonis TaxID=72036 RepID=A0A7R8CX76_LEPSM|nr:unnamed protein product [Lepeophtheirus salmonis]CAF2912660.1 unnamed protein product [Lepeophtheirus salmonis]
MNVISIASRLPFASRRNYEVLQGSDIEDESYIESLPRRTPIPRPESNKRIIINTPITEDDDFNTYYFEDDPHFCASTWFRIVLLTIILIIFGLIYFVTRSKSGSHPI